MSFKVVHYINQFFAQIGGEEMAHVAPELREGFVGPGMALNTAWKGEAVTLPFDEDEYYEELMKRVATSRRKTNVVAQVADTAGTFAGTK